MIMKHIDEKGDQEVLENVDALLNCGIDPNLDSEGAKEQ